MAEAEGPGPGAAIGERRLFVFGRDLLEEALEHPDRKGKVEDRVDQHEGRDLVVEANRAHDREVRDDDCDWWQEPKRERPVKDEAAHPAPDWEPRDRVADGKRDCDGD